MDRLFSIIIPCYNAEEYIDRMMSSLMNQTIGADLFEIIAVNDASTDNTLSLLNKWEISYPNTVRVITDDENLRQGGARNKAIKAASGKYICFLDADDWMEPDALETFMVATDSGYDIVTALFTEDSEYSVLYEETGGGAREDAHIQRIFDNRDPGEYIAFDLGFVWSSVYRREIITENEVWFPEHLAYEDIYWQRLIKFYSQKACVLDKVTHHHYFHPESTMNKKNASHHIDRLTCYEMLLDEYQKRALIGKYYPQILKDSVETYVFNSYFMFFTLMDDIPDVYNRIRKTLYKYFPDWERAYDSTDIPIVFQYLLKFLAKASSAKPADLQPFKDSILELIQE